MANAVRSRIEEGNSLRSVASEERGEREKVLLGMSFPHADQSKSRDELICSDKFQFRLYLKQCL